MFLCTHIKNLSRTHPLLQSLENSLSLLVPFQELQPKHKGVKMFQFAWYKTKSAVLPVCCMSRPRVEGFFGASLVLEHVFFGMIRAPTVNGESVKVLERDSAL